MTSSKLTEPLGLAPRIVAANDRAIRASGSYVLYWMIAARRAAWNHALDRALAWCEELGKPLLVLEALRLDYPWASARMHAFALQGMRDNAAAFGAAGVAYVPYVEPRQGAGRGLVAALARHACVVVTDEFPCFFLPRATAAAARQIEARLETVDGNGVLPLRTFDRPFTTAASFRWAWQKVMAPYLVHMPASAPLQGAGRARGAQVPEDVARTWPPADVGDPLALVRALAVDPSVAPSPISGGSRAANARLDDFLATKLARYAERSHPDADVGSGLSPYLHFGHISAHQVVDAVLRAADWTPSLVGAKANGKREGWWNLPAAPEAFMDELVTWRELGYGFCFHRRDYDRYESLPGWALATLSKHAGDARPWRYTLAQLAAAQTHDPLWNAAQRQLVADGVMHNYMRMLWGKKILEWSPTPQTALEILIELNNRYALDGRNPNSYSGIFWTLGRFDRAWGPERAIFGSVRYMSSDNTARKLDLKRYLARWGQPSQGRLPL